MKVDTVTFYRWELGQRVPTHGANLGNYARFLKRLGVENDPAMREDVDSLIEVEVRELESA